MKKPIVTVWFGKEIDISTVKMAVKNLYSKGYEVRAPFYIIYDIDVDLVQEFLKESVRTSDCLYLLGNEGCLLENISNYAKNLGKPIYREEIGLCYQN